MIGGFGGRGAGVGRNVSGNNGAEGQVRAGTGKETRRQEALENKVV